MARKPADHTTDPAAATPPCNSSALRKAARRMSMLYGSVLAPSGLNNAQHSLLAHIERGRSPTMGELAADMVLDRSALSHNLKPLERDGLVALVQDSTDRRSRRVTLTPAGHAKLAETRALWRQAHCRFETVYGHEKAARLRELLEDIYSEELAAAFHAAA